MLDAGVVGGVSSLGIQTLSVQVRLSRDRPVVGNGQVVQTWATGPRYGAVHTIHGLGVLQVDVCRAVLYFRTRW
jgi:hypothetical protein